jgi:hypothetical protein
LSEAKQNRKAPTGERLLLKTLKYLEKIWIAEFGTPFA